MLQCSPETYPYPDPKRQAQCFPSLNYAENPQFTFTLAGVTSLPWMMHSPLPPSSSPSTCLEFLNSKVKLYPHFGLTSRSLPFTQYGHNKCALLTFPHAEHLFKLVTSFNAFPAINLERFFICDVFFFGTARSIDSHIPESRDGMLNCTAAGRASEKGVEAR